MGLLDLRVAMYPHGKDYRHPFEGNGKRCDRCFALREDENHAVVERPRVIFGPTGPTHAPCPVQGPYAPEGGPATSIEEYAPTQMPKDN